ncbi:hypothetical protein B0J18DRAFT_160228 [Chaetomium sp. MPI-SDFR-AT-0129]|nr:hypothetical protein B0J18DRAFT_160228 [Chaetomium sp. MPI-SDFR-AT-0129]
MDTTNPRDIQPTASTFPDRGPAVFAVTTATLGLATVFVAARLVSRIGLVRRTGWDDYMIVLAWLLAVFLGLSIDLGTREGLGRHDEDIEDERRGVLRMCEYVFSILYNPALMATKTSILIFYLRLSKNTQKVLRLASWAVLGVVNLAGTILTFLNIFQCTPTRAAWDIHTPPIRCIPLLTEFICSAPVNITTDLAILALPIPVLTGMRLPPRQKTILVLTFALGVFVTIVDVVRIYYLQQAIDHVPTSASADPSAAFGMSVDFSWNASFSLMWSAVEVNVGIICACIPTLKPLIIRILPAMIIDPDGTLRSSTGTVDSTTASAKDERGGVAAGGESVGIQVAIPAPTLSLTPPAEEEDTASPSLLGLGSQSGSEDISIRDFLATTSPNPTHPYHHHHHHHSHHNHNHRRSILTDTTTMTTTTSATTTTTTHRHSWQSRHSRRSSRQVYFGFVNMRPPKNLLTTSLRGSLRYGTVTSILFFLWGFSYGLLNTLNNAVAAVANMTQAQTLGLTAVYFGGGYLLGPLLVGGWLLRHDEHHWLRGECARTADGGGAANEDVGGNPAGSSRINRSVRRRPRRPRRRRTGDESVGGFKATFIAGLCIYGAGTIMFWPGAVVGSYGGFMASSFVVGFGLAVLETAANPFLILCGPPEYADARLLLAQAVQAVGSVLSGLLADRVFFAARLERGHSDSSTSSSGSSSTILIEVQWTYLAITLSSVLLALFFFYMPLPEVTDAELAASAAARSRNLPVPPERKSIAGISLRTWALALAVLAQWCYVSAQENMSLFFEQLISAFVTPANGDRDAALASSQTGGGAGGGGPGGLALSLPNYLFVAHTAFAVSRFVAAGVCIWAVQREQNKPSALPDDNLTTNPPNNPNTHKTNKYTNTPLTLLLLSILLSTLSLLTVLVLPPEPTNPNLATLPILLFFFFEGPIWPLIFSLGLRGQGVRTKQAAAWLTMGGCGPGVWPFVSYGILQRGGGPQAGGRNVQVSLVVVVVLMAVAGVYPGFLMGVKGGREMVGLQMPLSRRTDDDNDAGHRNGNRNGNGTGNGNESDDDDDDNDNDTSSSSSAQNGDIEQAQQHGSKNRGSLSQHLFPGWSHHNTTRPSQQSGQGQGNEKEKEDAPWESQVLDTSILRDMP